MPLRDHFRPPLDDLRHWEGFHATWPVMITAQLRKRLPQGFFAAPRVRSESGLYEVLVYDEKRRCAPVAAVKLVSPPIKDHPEHRRAFVAKCAAMLQQRASVVIVDVVTISAPNLYGELLELIGVSDPGLTPEQPPTYFAACRATKQQDKARLETWTQPLALGRPLPTTPLWLADNLALPLELEESYEQSCGILNIP